MVFLFSYRPLMNNYFVAAETVSKKKQKMQEMGIAADHVIRHYDVNGKTCRKGKTSGKYTDRAYDGAARFPDFSGDNMDQPSVFLPEL